MKKFIYLISAFVFLAAGNAYGQQDAQFTMPMFNRQVFNPGFVGAPGAPELTMCGRTQWVGIDGHPNTFTLSGNMPVSILRGGLGLHLINDQIGPFNTNIIRLSYAFHLPIGNNGGKLQLGIGPSINLSNLDGTELRPAEDLDPTLRGLIGAQLNHTALDLGAGVYYHIPTKGANDNLDKFYIGFAADHLLEPQRNYGDEGPQETFVYRTFGLMAGYRFGNGPISFVPNFYGKMVKNLRMFDLVGNLHVRPMVFGAGVRASETNADAILALIGFNASQRLFVAYSYDYTLSDLSVSTSGSHEVILKYTFPKVTRFYPPNLDTKYKPVIR